ncbi:MAG: metallophosphoesterase [Deltaproteobacteria bacterium]|nr:metallophosphoesterase [Deltaproteobacteria bacterium]
MSKLRLVLATALVASLVQVPDAEARGARGTRARARARVERPRPVRRPRIRTTPVYRRPFQADPTVVRPNAPGKTRFAVIGDSGSGGAKQMAVAQQMARVFSKRPFESLVMLGDNVYENGEPHKMPKAIVGAYGRLFNKGVRALPTLGNHDIRTENGNAQLKYFGLGSRRFYKTRLAGGDVELFSVDTTLLLPHKNYYPEGWRAKEAARQKQWLAKSLAQSKARYKLVIGHHPMYSSGESTGVDEGVIRQQLDGLLRDHKVSAYLSGHHHHYERSRPQGGVTHFVSGGGGKDSWRKGLEAPNANRAAGKRASQFMLFELKAGKLHFESIDSAGKVLDHGVLPPSSGAAP